MDYAAVGSNVLLESVIRNLRSCEGCPSRTAGGPHRRSVRKRFNSQL